MLVVEDEEPVRNLAARILSGRGYQILTAGSGKEALEVVNKYSAKIDLLLTDVVLPGMIGGEIADALREADPDLKVLYMSGYTKNAIVQQGRLEKDVNLLEKPFGPRELAEAVRQVIDREPPTASCTRREAS